MKFEVSVPLLGFDDLKSVELNKIDDVFMKMQSLQDPRVSFTLINPFILRDYDFEVPDATKDLLGITDKSNLLVLNIVLIQTPIEDSIVNFIGPLVFNTDTNRVAQIILQEATNYGVAEKISTFLKK